MIQRLSRYGAYGLLALMMPLAVVLTATLHYAFNDGFYLAFFQENQTAAMLEISDADMTRVVSGMTDYLSGKSPTMDLSVTLDGETARFYNDRELTHMVDVQKLMALGGRVRTVFFAAGAALLVLLARFGGLRRFWEGVLASSLGAFGFAAFLGVLAATDFTAAFYRFHEMFFTNDLWLLDPATSRLIRMLPEQFFFDMTARILTASGAVVVTAALAALWGLKRTARRKGGW